MRMQICDIMSVCNEQCHPTKMTYAVFTLDAYDMNLLDDSEHHIEKVHLQSLEGCVIIIRPLPRLARLASALSRRRQAARMQQCIANM